MNPKPNSPLRFVGSRVLIHIKETTETLVVEYANDRYGGTVYSEEMRLDDKEAIRALLAELREIEWYPVYNAVQQSLAHWEEYQNTH